MLPESGHSARIIPGSYATLCDLYLDAIRIRSARTQSELTKIEIASSESLQGCTICTISPPPISVYRCPLRFCQFALPYIVLLTILETVRCHSCGLSIYE